MILTLAAAGLFLLTSCGPKLHRYGCNRKRCITLIEKTDTKPMPTERIAKKTKATV